MDFSKKLDDNNTLCVESPSSIFESEHQQQQQQQQHQHNNDQQKSQQQQQEMDMDMQEAKDRSDTPSMSTSGSRDVEFMLRSKSPEDTDNNNRKSDDGGDLLSATDNLLESGLDIEGALNDGMDNVCGTDTLGNNFVENSDQMSPSARLLTSTSDVVGLNALLDADDDLPPLGAGQMHKSRSMPASPATTAAAAAAAAATSAMLLPHMNALFDYNVGSMGEMRPPSRMLEARRKRLRDTKVQSNSPPGGAGGNHQQFCLRWNNYQTNLTNVFDELLQSESFVDVTLACEGQSVKAHKMVLSACSPYFQALFFDNPCQHPIIIMRDVRWQELKAIMEFMYKGEINVSQEQIDPLLKVAEMLKIRGLAEVSSRNGARDERDVSLAAAHTMLPPEQHMSVYDDDLDDDVDEDVMRNVAAMADPRLAEHDDDDETQKIKRSRLAHCSDVLDKLPRALDLNLSALQQRKRSRDGILMADGDESRSQTQNSRSPTPTIKTRSSNAGESTGTPPPSVVTATASTIVRNPFASPNANNNMSEQSANSISQAASVANTSISSMSTATELGASCATLNTSGAYRQSPALSQHSPNASRSGDSTSGNINNSNKNNNNNNSNSNNNNSNNNNNAVCSSSNSGSCDFGSSSAMSHQMPSHSHSVSAAAAAAAFSNSHLLPHQTHHHHHHHAAAAAAAQLSAQHPLHASHSHAAIASALAAVAAGAGPGSGVPGQSSGGSMGGPSSHHDDLEIKPEIAEMIREEERAKMIEGGHPWLSGAAGSSVADSYQYQLQSMWQKCWNTNQQNLVQQLRFRERGPLKSWRPEAMAEAIFSVLKEGLSLSQAARKYDIPYPTFVLYANRVHNMLGPSLDGGTDPRPKARGRPQRILLGMWPEELIRSVIKAVVFRDYREIKEETGHAYANGQTHISPFGTPTNPAATAAAMAANGYNNVAKLVVQNSALAPPNSPSPLSTMSESLRRQIMSQQQQSPISQTMNMYKSPAYLQRSEIEDQVSKQPTDRRGVENLPDITGMGLMGVPGLNVMPSDPTQRGAQLHGNASAFSRERELECERSRERERERAHELTARSFGNQTRGGMPSNVQKQQQSKMSVGGSGSGSSSGNISCTSTSGGPISPFSAHFKQKEHHPNYAYNKRFLESLPPGIDFEALANGLLQKSVNKSPRFEDFFPGQEINELFANASDPKSTSGGAGSSGSVGPGAGSTSSSSASSYAAMRDSAQLMKIKLEQQAGEIPHED